MIPLPDLLKYEFSRLEKKSIYGIYIGYGLILSIITFSFYFTYYPDLLALIWPTLLKTMPGNLFTYLRDISFYSCFGWH